MPNTFGRQVDLAQPIWHSGGMDADPLAKVTAAVKARDRADKRLASARYDLHSAIVDALAAGVRVTDLVEATGYTRERIRQLRKQFSFTGQDIDG